MAARLRRARRSPTAQDPLFTHLLNVPDGVNLAVNTSITVYAVVFAPLTYLVGPPVTFLVILTLNLAAHRASPGTGCSPGTWSRSRLGRAPLGGLFCGFAPGMVSHANAHLNWTAGWLVPLLVLGGCSGCASRAAGCATASILGVLVAVAFSIAAEGLFFTALACGVFLGRLGAAPGRRAEAAPRCPTVLRGLGVTAVVAGVLLAYPLWLHFAGPQRFHGTGFDPRVHAEDIAAYGAFPSARWPAWLGLDTAPGAEPDRGELVLRPAAAAARRGLLRAAVAARRPGPPGHAARARRHRGGLHAALLGPRLQVRRPAHRRSRCRTRCWATCRCSTPRCRPGSPWWSRR